MSLVAAAANDRCKVLDRKPSIADPFRALRQTKQREFELFEQAFAVINRGLEALRHV